MDEHSQPTCELYQLIYSPPRNPSSGSEANDKKFVDDYLNNLTAITAPAQDDYIPLYDTSNSGDRKITIGDIRQDINNDQTGTTYSLVLGDAGKSVWMNNASANTLTIPLNSSVAFPINTVITVVMEGAGTTSVEGATGVTLNGVSGGSGDIDGQYKGVTLIKRTTNTWIALGAIGTVA